MRLSPRVLAAIAGAALLTAACAGGGGGASPSGSGAASPSGEAGSSDGSPVRSDADLVIWTDEITASAVRPIAEEFAAERGITVGVQVIASDLQANVVAANAAGNGPDVFTGAHDWIGNLAQNGAISPLQITVDRLSEYADIAVQAGTYQDKIYALPYGLEALVLYRNTDVAPQEPKTLDDAIMTGEAAVTAGTVDSALNLQQGDLGDTYYMEPVFTSMGGYLFGTTASGDADPDDLGVGKPGSIAAAKKIYALGEKGLDVLRRSISADNSLALFAGGKAAYVVSGPWALEDVQAGGIKYAISPIPGFAGQKPAQPFTGVHGFYVASKGTNQAFAQEFVVNAVNTEESMKAMYDGTSLPPAMNVVADKVGAADPDITVFVEAAKAGHAIPAIPAMQEVWEPLGAAYAAIIGGADPTKTMTDTGKVIAAAIG